jgi:outer membrane protein TolC
LRRFEAEMATRLAVLQNQQQMLTARDEPVPAQYREMVDKYFEMLSKKK